MSGGPEGAMLDLADAEDDARVEPAREPGPAAWTRPRPSDAAGTIARRAVLAAGLAVLAFAAFAWWFSGLAHARSQVGLQRRFAVELENALAPIGGAIEQGAPVAVVRISHIGVSEVVVEGTRSGELRLGPGHVVGSSLPGQPGNAVIAGRRTLYGGPFRHLGALRAGDAVEVTTGQGRASYRVTRVARMRATDGAMLANQGDDRLTLFTASSGLLADERLVVTASLQGQPFPATALRRTLDPEGLGLTGERNAIAIVLIWLELLLACALLAVVARSRWSWIATWVVFAPALALLLWLVFENAVRLLPATL